MKGEVNYNQYKNYNFISIFNNFITYDMIGIIELHEMEDIVITLFELNDGSLV